MFFAQYYLEKQVVVVIYNGSCHSPFLFIFICTCSAGVKPGNIAAVRSKFIYLLYIFLLLSFVFVYVDAMPNEPEEEEELP